MNGDDACEAGFPVLAEGDHLVVIEIRRIKNIHPSLPFGPNPMPTLLRAC
jgi:hypothetical protein